MRVLMICPELPAKNLPGSMAPCARQIESLRGLGLSIDVVDMCGIPKLKYLQSIPRIRRLARRTDIIHAHFGYCAWLGRMAPVLTGTKAPLVISYMGDDLLGTPSNGEGDLTRFSRIMVRANKQLAAWADQVIVKSREMADVISPTPAAVIPNGVDVSLFHPIDQTKARCASGLPVAGHTVLFPGNPDNPRKGHALATAAVDCAAEILGEPISLVPLWGVAPDQVVNYMNACDVILMTSLIEGSPNVVKEAMACNRPVIGVDVGDVAEMLRGVQGCAVCDRDPEAIGQRLAAWLQNPGVVDGRATLLRRGMDLESVAGRVIDIYKKALNRPAPKPILTD